MLTNCGNCGFYVRKYDDFCPNCGFSNPASPLYKPSFNYFRFGSLILGGVILTYPLFVLIITGKTSLTFSFSSLISAIICSSIASTLTEIVWEYRIKESNYESRKNGNPDNLINKQQIIESRLSELISRYKQIETVLGRIKSSDGEKLKFVEQKLLSAREIVTSQIARYELQNHKIGLVRLQNSVSPFLFFHNRLTEPETEQGLLTIERAKYEIGKIRQTLTNYVAIEFPAETLDEKSHFLLQLDDTENSCEKLREALLSKQAAHALKGIAPIEESLQLPETKDAVHSAETFNLQTILTDFSESFDELEREYRRVRAESEVSRKLLEN